MTDAAEKVVGADRVIAVLTELADHPLGVTLDELAGILNSSKPTVHRALATLRRAGLADLVERGVYVLGDEYLRLAFRNLDGRPETKNWPLASGRRRIMRCCRERTSCTARRWIPRRER
jgi:IclR family acetate operon transcriptional repressor